MGKIQKNIKFKKNKIEETDFYLGAILKKKELKSQTMWAMTIQDYIKNAIENLENKLNKKGIKLNSRAGTTVSMGYQPELDSSLELNQDGITTFQELIGILWWEFDIGRVGILKEMYKLSSYQASPRKRHMKQIYHLLDFLKNNSKLNLYFDPRNPLIDQYWFQVDSFENFKDQYQYSE